MGFLENLKGITQYARSATLGRRPVLTHLVQTGKVEKISPLRAVQSYVDGTLAFYNRRSAPSTFIAELRTASVALGTGVWALFRGSQAIHRSYEELKSEASTDINRIRYASGLEILFDQKNDAIVVAAVSAGMGYANTGCQIELFSFPVNQIVGSEDYICDLGRTVDQLSEHREVFAYLVKLKEKFPEIEIRIEGTQYNPNLNMSDGHRFSLVFPESETPNTPRITVEFLTTKRTHGGIKEIVDYEKMEKELAVLFLAGCRFNDIQRNVTVTPKGWKVADCTGTVEKYFTSLFEAEEWYSDITDHLLSALGYEDLKPLIMETNMQGGYLVHRKEGGWHFLINKTPGEKGQYADIKKLEAEVLKPLRRIKAAVERSGGRLTLRCSPSPGSRTNDGYMYSSPDDYFCVSTQGADGKLNTKTFHSLQELVTAYPEE